MAVGATSVLMAERPTPAAVGRVLRQHRPTIFYGVPTLYNAMLASNDLPRREELALRRCVSAGEPLPPEIGRRWSARIGGALLVSGPTRAAGYWNNRERSRATFNGIWTRTGDKYFEDEDGYYVYCGRSDDMLKVSGMYVSPAEVEAALIAHPDVLEAAVVGVPDD